MGPQSARPTDLDDYAKALIRTKARRLAARSGFTSNDKEDVAQELAAELIKRSDLFDPSRASWGTFVAQVVDSAVAMLLRHRGRKKRAAGYRIRSLDADGDACGGPTAMRDRLTEADRGRRLGMATCADVVELREQADRVHGALASLPSDLRAICARLTDGTVAGVARELGVSRRQVRNAIQRIRRHFAAAGLGDSREQRTAPPEKA